MTIQLTQVSINNIYKDDIYVTISEDSEIDGLLYFKFYNNVNSIIVELMQPARKEVIRKILLMEHINKVIYRDENGLKQEENNSGRKLIVKRNEGEDKSLILDDTIIKFQQILDIDNNLVYLF